MLLTRAGGRTSKSAIIWGVRSHLSRDITDSLIGKRVTVCGWARARRDHGGVIFIDLRDKHGIVQLVAQPDAAAVFAVADRVRNEYVLRAGGSVRARMEGTINEKLASGRVEIELADLEILNACDSLPFLPNDEVNEETRLRHRVVDLRSDAMQTRLSLRHELATAVRNWLNANAFMEIETPMLTRATPEGARDFIIPSRLQKGEFYALPQSPQLFKQMLMAAGFDRYYQIARCFRDEDLRADRQPEFTQIDIEMSFVEEADVMMAMEAMVLEVFGKVGVKLPSPFPKMKWADAMRDFGCDRPDLRNPLRLTELTDCLHATEFKVFREASQSKSGRVAAVRLPGGAQLTRKEIDTLTEFVGGYGAKGLAWIKCINIAAKDLQSPIVKFLDADTLDAILQRTMATDGDILFFGAGESAIVNASLAALRDKLGQDQELIDNNAMQPLWVVDFPMFEWDGNRYQACHHPFTAPRDPTKIADGDGGLARAYDLVLNGSEIGGGSIRIHQTAVQEAVLDRLGINAQQAKEQFGFLLEALNSGAPPHGGIAFGLDRITAMVSKTDSIRDVIAFPKTQRGQCLLTGAPAPPPLTDVVRRCAQDATDATAFLPVG